jgi:hypothetical protein
MNNRSNLGSLEFNERFQNRGPVPRHLDSGIV